MGRIPEAELERLKKDVDLVALVSARGVELKKHGANWVGRCPFHNDRGPSLVVTPSKGLWNCLGACRQGGTVIDWVMKVEGVSFKKAAEWLREGYSCLPKEKARAAGGKAEPVKRRAAAADTPAPSPREFVEADAQEMLQEAVRYYHHTLKTDGAAALSYLEARGIRSDEAIDHFQLGYSNRSLRRAFSIRAKQDGDGEETPLLRKKLIECGIYRESAHELLAGSITIPILGHQGVVKGLYGRKTCDHLKSGTAYHLYLPGPHRGVWNLEGFQHESRDLILCEALIDALTFWVHGFRNVTASYGITGFTEHHWNAIRDAQIKRVFIAYDRDEAGDGAAAALAEELSARGIVCHRVLFPKGMDANEYALKMQPPAMALRVCLETAPLMRKGVLAMKPPSSRGFLPLAAVAASPAAAEVPPEPSPKTSDDARAQELAVVHSPGGMALAREAAESRPGVERPTQPVTPTTSNAAKDKSAGELAVLDQIESATHPAEPVRLAQEGTPRDAVIIETRDGDLFAQIGPREYRVRGLGKNLAYEVMKVNVRVTEETRFHIDTLDLFQAKARTAYIHGASDELGVKPETLRQELSRLLSKLEEIQGAEIRRVLEATKPVKLPREEMSADDRAEALALLRRPDLLACILEDFSACGVVGEETNKLIGYLAVVSRKLDDPLAVIIQSSSAAGKSSLMEAILAMVPEEDQVKYSAMTGQSLFYMGENDLKHKILAIAEEQGAQQASYALKLLQSEGEVRIASTGKDAQTGRLVTHQYRVEGPTMIFLTTTAIEIDEELLNRCLVLTVNETREQTRAIHELQRKGQTIAGLMRRRDRSQRLKRHQNAQRLLRPLLVANPFAEKLTFLDSRTRSRRDHMKYLTLIRTIALLHQYGREVKQLEHRGECLEYIEVTPADIEVAHELCHQVLGRSIDELPPQTRKLLDLLSQMAEEDCKQAGIARQDHRFTRRTARERIGWSDFQMHVHITKLVSLEYVLAHRGSQGSQFVYELLWSGGSGARAGSNPTLSGLMDPQTLVTPAADSGSGAEKITQHLLHGEGQSLGRLSPELAPSWVGSRSLETQAGRGLPGEKAEVPAEKDEGGASDASIDDDSRPALKSGGAR